MVSTAFFLKPQKSRALRQLLIKAVVGGVFFITPQAKAAEALNLYKLKLESLSDFTEFKTETLRGKPSIWVLFQPGCGSCKAQLKELACVPTDIEKIALGVKGSREQLLKELRFVTKGQKRLRATRELEKQLKVQGTPTIFAVNADGIIHNQVMGLNTCEQLKQFAKSKE